MTCSFCLRPKVAVERKGGFLIEAPEAPGIYICSECVVKFKKELTKEVQRDMTE